MYLGIDQQSGLVYEGLEDPVLPVVPRPTVTQAKLIKREEDWNDLPTGIAHSPMSWVFREDTFDPVTRTRRGRLFEPEPAQPKQYRVLPDPYEDPHGRTTGAQGRARKNLYAYKACVSLLREPHQGMGLKLALGGEGRSLCMAHRTDRSRRERLRHGHAEVAFRIRHPSGRRYDENCPRVRTSDFPGGRACA